MAYKLYPPEPRYSCRTCRRVVIVTPDGRGFPPDIAKRKLIRICAANGCECEPHYQAGLILTPPLSGEAAPERSEG